MRGLFFLFLSLLLTSSVQGRILRTNNTPGSSAEFSTLDAAYQNAVDGDTIYLEGSEYSYAKSFSKFIINKSITLLGPGYFLLENGVVSYGTTSAFIGTGSTLEIRKENVVIKSIACAEVLVKASNVIITRCQLGSINANDEFGDIFNVAIHQCYITGSISSSTSKYLTRMQITNNIMYGSEIRNVGNSTFAYNHIDVFSARVYSCTFKNNMVYLRSGDKIAGENNYFGTSNYFNNWKTECLGGDSGFLTDIPYQLTSNSPLRKMATDGGEIGAFGGNDPYVISGIPNIPLIKSMDVDASGNEVDGLKVKITISTER